MTTISLPARRPQTDTWLLILMAWHGVLAMAGVIAAVTILTSVPGGLRFVVAGVILALALLSVAAVPFILRRDHRGRVLSLVVNYLGFLACAAMLLHLLARSRASTTSPSALAAGCPSC